MSTAQVDLKQSDDEMRHRELTALDAVGRLAGESYELQEMVRLALNKVSDVTGVDIAGVSLVDEEEGLLKVLECCQPGRELLRETGDVWLSGGLAQSVADTGEILVVEDISVDPRFSHFSARERLVGSYVGVPLKSRGKVLGVVSVGSRDPRVFSSNELAFLSIMAGQLGGFVENALLDEQLGRSEFRLRERVKELSILYDISRQAELAPDINTYLSFVARRLPASMQYQQAVAVIFCVVEDREYVAWSDNIDKASAEQLLIVPGQRTLGRLLADKGALLEYAIASLDPFWADCDVESVLAVPIAVNGHAVGSIAVYYLSDRWRFLEEEKHLLRGISEQIAQYLSRDAVERENRRRTQEISTLFEVSKVLASVVELEELLPAIEPTLVETLEPADAGALLLFGEATGMLTVESAFGYDMAAVRRLSLQVGESMSGMVFEDGEPGVWPTPEECASAMAHMAPHNRRRFREATGGLDYPSSAIAVPLVYRDQRIGVLTLETFQGNASFSLSHLPFLQALAELIVIDVNQIQLLQRTEQARAAEDVDRLRSEVIAALAHEMRTPLTSIQGYASALLLEDVEWDQQTSRRHLQIIDEEASALSAMIEDLLESSIIDSGFLPIEREPTLIPRLAERLVKEMTRRTARHRFVISFPSDFPIVDADPRRIEQVLRNLLDNAVKYSPEGGLVVVRGEVVADEVTVSVADNGAGIAPEHLNRLFEKFFRVKSPLGQRVRGSGLGLPLSRTIVESHGGRIWAESELGRGTTIYFSLPCSGAPLDVDQD